MLMSYRIENYYPTPLPCALNDRITCRHIAKLQCHKCHAAK